VGHGLVGMRERAGLFGGTLDAGPAAGGGWRVCASFPIEPAGDGGEGPAPLGAPGQTSAARDSEPPPVLRQ